MVFLLYVLLDKRFIYLLKYLFKFLDIDLFGKDFIFIRMLYSFFVK